MRAPVLRLAPCFALGASLAVPRVSLEVRSTEEPQPQEGTVPYAASRPRDPMAGPDGDIWFGADTNTVGVARLPLAPPVSH